MKLKLLAVAIGTALLSGCSLFQNPLRDYIGVWEIKKRKDTYCYVHPDGTVVLESRHKTEAVFKAKFEEDAVLLKVRSGRESDELAKVEVRMRRSGDSLLLDMKNCDEERTFELSRADKPLEDDVSLASRKARRRKQDKTADYMPVDFAPPAMSYETLDGCISITVLNDDDCAIFRRKVKDLKEGTCVIERICHVDRDHEDGVRLTSFDEERTSCFHITKDGRFIEYGTTGEAKGKLIGLPVKMKKVDIDPQEGDYDGYFGLWSGSENNYEVKLLIRKDGRIIRESKNRYDETGNTTLLYQHRYGMLFAYEDGGPTVHYEQWSKYRYRFDKESKRLMVAQGNGQEYPLTYCGSGEGSKMEDELELRRRRMEFCSYDGVWEGGESFHSFSFLFDDDGAFCMIAGMSVGFGTWKAKPDGTITVTFEDGQKLTLNYSPYEDTIQAQTRQRHRGRRMKNAEPHPVRSFKKEHSKAWGDR